MKLEALEKELTNAGQADILAGLNKLTADEIDTLIMNLQTIDIKYVQGLFD